MLVMMAWRHRTAAAAAGAWMNELYKDDNLAKYARGSSWLQYASATLCRPPAHASSAPTLRGIVLYLQCDDTGSSTLSFNDDRTSLLYRSIDTDHYTPQRTWTSNNKWSKNVDERPHRRLVTPLGGKWIRRTLIYGSLGPSRAALKRLLGPFSRFCVHCSQDTQCFSVGRTTPKIAPFPWRICTPSNTWFLGPTWDSDSWPWPLTFWPQNNGLPGLIVEHLYVKFGDPSCIAFYRDAMLPLYMLPSCVSPSVRPSVRLSTRPSQAGTVQKRLNKGSCK